MDYLAGISIWRDTELAQQGKIILSKNVNRSIFRFIVYDRARTKGFEQVVWHKYDRKAAAKARIYIGRLTPFYMAL